MPGVVTMPAFSRRCAVNDADVYLGPEWYFGLPPDRFAREAEYEQTRRALGRMSAGSQVPPFC